MTLEELAHWRYRHRAIEGELRDLTDVLNKLKRWQIDQKLKNLREQENEQGYRATEKQIRDSAAASTEYDDDIKRIAVIVQADTYLLEEARYKITLGEVMTGVPAAESTVEAPAGDGE